MSFKIVYKTQHNMFYRRHWFAEKISSASLNSTDGTSHAVWHVELKWGRDLLLPKEGTILRLGRGNNLFKPEIPKPE